MKALKFLRILQNAMNGRVWSKETQGKGKGKRTPLEPRFLRNNKNKQGNTQTERITKRRKKSSSFQGTKEYGSEGGDEIMEKK